MNLRDAYDALLLDLDGTLYRGQAAIASAVAALAVASDQRMVYVTNNASRSAGDVARHLRELGYRAAEDDVVTSAQAAARMVADRVEPGRAVLVVGAQALADEIEALGLRPVRSAEDDPVAVVQGHSPSTAWPILAEAAYAIRSGALWVAANTDTTLPTERGLAPGNGSMVAALAAAADATPLVAGKPWEPLLEAALVRAGTRNALVVGDRVDTDIYGARRVGLDSLLVLTGVSTREEVDAGDSRPTYLADSLTVLNEPAERSRT